MTFEKLKDEFIGFLIPLIIFLVTSLTCLGIYFGTNYDLWLELSVIFTTTTLIQAVMECIHVARMKNENKVDKKEK